MRFEHFIAILLTILLGLLLAIAYAPACDADEQVWVTTYPSNNRGESYSFQRSDGSSGSVWREPDGGVTIYDTRSDDDSDHWVDPWGLPEEDAALWR